MFKLSLLVLLFPFSTGADGIKYFDSKINYWGEPVPTTLESVQPESKVEGAFPWKAYLDPKNKEFFKEGDYTPPEPFMEIARNPTDENLKNWFKFMETKNEVARRLDQRMREYLGKNAATGPMPQAVMVAPKQEPSAPIAINPVRFKVRMYFESTCPHCERMFGVLKKLSDDGFQVEALQIDKGALSPEKQVVPVSQAEKADLKKHNVTGVPHILIADTKRKALLPPIQGFHDYGEMIALLKAASR